MPESAAPRAFDQPIYVTRPLLPDLHAYLGELQGVWDRRWLTNKGEVHDTFEAALCAYLRAPHLSLVNSGTTALMLALRALDLLGEVITTPLTSPATVNAIAWCGLTPVFADVDPVSLTLDPSAVERAITPRTAAIVGVHVYGMPCDVDALQAIADRHKLRLVYDGAHAFGTEINGVPLLEFGDATALSFHATKLFSTAEGGAVAARDEGLKQRIDLLKNLGIQNEATVAVAGLNGRMNELSAALGLVSLKLVEAEQDKRSAIAEVYRDRLRDIDGLTCFTIPPHVRNSEQYFIVRLEAGLAARTRDDVWERMQAFHVVARRYFHPLCSNTAPYRDLPSSAPSNLPVATRAADEVLCLPFYGDLGTDDAARIADVLRHVLNV